MKIVEEIPCYEYYEHGSMAADDTIQQVVSAGGDKKAAELDMLLDLWFPDGQTVADWDKFLVEHREHILNKLNIGYEK